MKVKSMRNLKNIKSQEGFTLVEVLVSFMILSGVLGLIYQLLSTGHIRVKETENEIYAALLAKSLIADALDQRTIRQGHKDGFSWDIDVQKKRSDRQFLTELATVSVRVKWKGFRGGRFYEVKTLKLIPKRN